MTERDAGAGLTGSRCKGGRGGGGDGVDGARGTGSGTFAGRRLLVRTGVAQVGSRQLGVKAHRARHTLVLGQVVVAAKLTAACNTRKYVFIYLFIYRRLKAQSTSQGYVTSGLFTKLNLTQVENNTKHAHFTNVKHVNIIRKFVPSVFLSSKEWQIKLGDASGTIDHFGLAFQ